MNKRLEAYIEIAIKYLPVSGIVRENDNSIENKYSGYISSFGAAVINNGFLPAYMFYRKDDDHILILSSIYHLIKEREYTEAKNLKEYFDQNSKSESCVSKIIEAATALKLTMRTYTLVKSD